MNPINKKIKNNMPVNMAHQLSGYRHSSKHFPSCSAEERNSYRFGAFFLGGGNHPFKLAFPNYLKKKISRPV